MSGGSQLNILAQRLKGRLELSEQAREWTLLLQHLERVLGKKPDMNALLFLVGVNVLGQGPRDFTKEEKQDLMHIALCELLSFVEYFEYSGRDEQGWPHYKPLRKPAVGGLSEQESLLRACAVQYFRENDEDFERFLLEPNSTPGQD
jgi:hypothetical protein